MHADLVNNFSLKDNNRRIEIKLTWLGDIGEEKLPSNGKKPQAEPTESAAYSHLRQQLDKAPSI